MRVKNNGIGEMRKIWDVGCEICDLGCKMEDVRMEDLELRDGLF